MSVSLAAFFWAFGSWKSAIPLMLPFQWDEPLRSAEAWLHGVQPDILLAPVFGSPGSIIALDRLYETWWFAQFGLLLWQVWQPDLAAAKRFLLAFALMWIVLGIFMATGFSSAGPCYAGLLTRDAPLRRVAHPAASGRCRRAAHRTSGAGLSLDRTPAGDGSTRRWDFGFSEPARRRRHAPRARPSAAKSHSGPAGLDVHGARVDRLDHAWLALRARWVCCGAGHRGLLGRRRLADDADSTGTGADPADVPGPNRRRISSRRGWRFGARRADRVGRCGPKDVVGSGRVWVHPQVERPLLADRQILLTGGAGFIGTSLAQRLVDHNRIVILDNCHRNAPKGDTLGWTPEPASHRGRCAGRRDHA